MAIEVTDPRLFNAERDRLLDDLARVTQERDAALALIRAMAALLHGFTPAPGTGGGQ
jgi:hypothetical protein